MSKQPPHIVLFIIFLLSCSCCFSQADVMVKASINRNKIIIGEPVELSLEAKLPAGTEGTWFPADSMTHFELIEKGRIDTIVTADSRTYRQTLIITSFDSGRWSVPSLPFTIGNKEYLTDSLPVSVAFSNQDTKQDYHDIKDIIEVENTATRYINTALLVLGLLSLAAIIYFLSRKAGSRQPAPASKPVSILPPLQEALLAIQELQRRSQTEPVRTKIFHSELNDILRQYLYRKSGTATMEKTSGELMLQLKQFNLPGNGFTTLAQVLRMNDAVKFAKYQPAENENQQAIETIKESVEQLDTIIS